MGFIEVLKWVLSPYFELLLMVILISRIISNILYHEKHIVSKDIIYINI